VREKLFKGIRIVLCTMSFDYRSQGIDGLIDDQGGVSIGEIDFWCKRITNDVKLKAPDDQANDFMMEVRVGLRQNPDIKISYLPSLQELLLQTIKNYVDQMPLTTRTVFEDLITSIENHGKTA